MFAAALPVFYSRSSFSCCARASANSRTFAVGSFVAGQTAWIGSLAVGSFEALRLVAANRAIYGRARSAGGTLYPVSAFPISRDGWRRHFGPEFTRLRDAKLRFDPGDVLTPGYTVL